MIEFQDDLHLGGVLSVDIMSQIRLHTEKILS